MYQIKVKADASRDANLPEFSQTTIKDRYCIDDEGPQDALARASAAFADDQEHADRLYDYASKQWFGFSSPILSNGGTDRGLPISCYLNMPDDSRAGISAHYDECIWLASNGGGIGSYWGEVRSNGVKTSRGVSAGGSIPFIKVIDSLMLATNQGDTRRGSAAIYQDISHPEIEEFIVGRKAAGDDNRRFTNLHHGINITDYFMECVRNDSEWPLVDPKSNTVVKTVRARALWKKIINTRKQMGEPYLHFIDASNRALPQPFKDRGMKVRQSNLCTEITLATDPDYTAVCCLSSVNAEKFQEWREDPLFLEDLARMLDNVLTHFIEFAPEQMHRAVKSAINERSIGLGCMGFHSYLQKHDIPFESETASYWNATIFSHIKEGMDAASRLLASERGEAPIMEGTGERFAHTTALAPNATSAIICGMTSPSTEPWPANVYLHKTLSGSFTVKNKYLEILLEKLGMNTPAVWKDILEHEGSVQHLEELSPHHRAVFKTAFEIDQDWIVRLGAERQIFIAQAQSVNLFYGSDATAVDMSRAHFKAWAMGMKSLYYLRSATARRLKTMKRTARAEIETPQFEDCLACEG